MYKYLVAFMWNSAGINKIKSVNVVLPSKIKEDTTALEIRDHVDKWAMIPKTDSLQLLAFSKYED